MPTTVSVDDKLLERARQRARRLGLTLGELIEEALRRELAGGHAEAERPTVPVFTRGTGVRPGVDLSSTRATLEVLDDDRPVEQLR